MGEINMAKTPIELAEEQEYVPFALDTKKYPDVQTTPYSFIYNIGNKSITDLSEQDAHLFRKPATKNKGFSLTVDGDEVYYPDFESAYQAAKKYNNTPLDRYGNPIDKENLDLYDDEDIYETDEKGFVLLPKRLKKGLN